MPSLKLSKCMLVYKISALRTEKNKWSTNSFSTEKLTKSKCQISLAVKYNHNDK